METPGVATGGASDAAGTPGFLPVAASPPTAGAAGRAVPEPGVQHAGTGRAVGLVLTAVLSVQFGAALAATIFPQVGPAGAVTLRLVGSAVVLGLVVRPRLPRSRTDLGVAAAFGVTLASMNLLFYEALARVPLGAAVTLEFLGPLGLAVVLSRRWRDAAWVGLAAAGVLLLGRGSLDGLGLILLRHIHHALGRGLLLLGLGGLRSTRRRARL